MCYNPHMVKILDCSIRDGGHQNNWNFDADFVFHYIEKLKSEKIDYCEIGYRNYIDKENKGEFFSCDRLFLEQFINNKGSLKIGVMADYKRINLKDFNSATDDVVDFVRIACHPADIADSLLVCEALKQNKYNVFLQLMEIPNVKEEHYNILNNWEYKDILESIYIADSYSTVTPKDIPVYFEKLKGIGFNKISFHAHNDKHMALDNTLKAISCGAFSVDVCQNNLGGNLNWNDYKNCL